MAYVRSAQNLNGVKFSCAYNCLFCFMSEIADRRVQVKKNDNFLVFLAVWGYIPMFLGKLRSGL